MDLLRGLDLFSGIGGITLALSDYVEPVAYCEIEQYAQCVLLSKMSEGKLPIAPIWDDVQTLKKEMLPSVDIIYGGFPCQDISIAGRGAGLEGKRSGLFKEIARLASELRPQFVFLENVPAITSRGLREVTGTMAGLGFDCRWLMLSAAEVGAPHKRNRWFLLGHAKRQRLEGHRENSRKKEESKFGNSSALADTNSLYKRYQQKQTKDKQSDCQHDDGDCLRNVFTRCRGQWAVEPHVGRVAYGIPFRVDRIKSLGNSVVPLQVKTAFEILAGIRNYK